MTQQEILDLAITATIDNAIRALYPFRDTRNLQTLEKVIEDGNHLLQQAKTLQKMKEELS